MNFGVMPLEGLWWTEDMRDFNVKDKSNWLWTAMIMQPDIVTEELFERAVVQVADKKKAKAREQRASRLLRRGPGRSGDVRGAVL